MNIQDLSVYDIPQDIIRAWINRWPRANLLPFQEKAFSDPPFWNERLNLVVQGPTSSGKTFIAEVLAAKTFAKRTANCIYLVPYRAMVSEKYEHFVKAFGADGLNYRIYPSSSDFQDYDEAIFKGRFDLAVMVYEKLFAMLSQSSSVISSCNLVAVDELQMINDSERGGKLELVLTRLLSHAREGRLIRTVGLGGVGSDLTQVIKWLGAYLLKNEERPLPLWEGVCNLDGTYRCRLVGTKQVGASNEQRQSIPLPPPAPSDLNQLAILLARFHAQQGHKVLIFRGTRAQAKATAFELAKYLRETTVIRSIRENLNQMEDTDTRHHLLSQLLHKGVAYHHAGLSFEERDLVESQFYEDTGLIRVVTATETLAVGVNLPADVVILADLRRPVSKSGFNSPPVLEAISVEDYRNCIGRAGRYGISHAKEGRSYILANNTAEADELWRSYILGESTIIDSVLQDSNRAPITDDEFRLAPYVLNRVAEEQQTSARRLTVFFGSSLAFSDSLERLPSFAQPLNISLSKLENLGLAERLADDWQVTSRGNAAARSAISIGAYEKIAQIINEMRVWQDDAFYAGNVLFGVCACPEIERLTNLGLSQEERFSGHTVQELWQRSDLQVAVAPESRLQKLIYDTDAPSPLETRRMKRALLLGQWMMGHSPSKIREKTGVREVAWGDLRIIGELASWMIEAASNIALIDANARKMVLPLRDLAGQVKYGVPAKGVYLAKLHVRGLHRGHIVKLIGSLEAGYTWDDYILKSASLPLPPHVVETLKNGLIERNTKHTREGRGMHLARVSRLIAASLAAEEWRDLVIKLYEATGTEFEEVVKSALAAAPVSLKCRRPSSSRRAEPDLVIECRGKCVLGECKRKLGKGQRVGWEDARQILTANATGMPEIANRFVIGYDGFDETAIEANNAQETPALLLPLDAFVEACLWTIEQDSSDALLRCLEQERGYLPRWDVEAVLQQYIA